MDGGQSRRTFDHTRKFEGYRSRRRKFEETRRSTGGIYTKTTKEYRTKGLIVSDRKSVLHVVEMSVLTLTITLGVEEVETPKRTMRQDNLSVCLNCGEIEEILTILSLFSAFSMSRIG
jgi:hypothetical protein